MLPEMKCITYDEFVNIDKNTDELLEYIDHDDEVIKSE